MPLQILSIVIIFIGNKKNVKLNLVETMAKFHMKY